MELFKILGTIAINNSEANKALSETSKHAKSSAKDVDDLGNSGEKSGGKLSKFFSAVGKGAAVAAKSLAVGIGAATTALGGLTVKALSAAGDLEQNIGGAEAVFGDLGKTIGDMKTPMQVYNAATGEVETVTKSLEDVSKQAFQNMGLSQTEYLSTANKMGALFKGAGFETQEALDLSSSAMQRAADVASIMGIDTASAMEAVAGAAKGNFTMMDNLGVAMNDTAIQAYAMEKGINKTTAEMTQQEKIGLAMEMFMEKTAYAAGNYAKENQTLAGSLGTAKAALTNFLSGAGSVEDVVASFSNFANVVVNMLDEMFPKLMTGLTQMVDQIVPLIPPLLQKVLPGLVEGATSLINGLVAALPGVLSALMGALPALIEGVMSIVNALITALPQIIQALCAALPTLLPLLIDALVSMIVTLCTMLPQIIQPIIDYLPEIIVSIVNALLQNLPALIQGCVQLVAGLIAALPQILVALWEAIKGIFGSLGNMIIGWFEPVKNAVSNAWAAMGNVPGLAQLKTMIEQVWGAIKTHISTIINAIKNVVGTVWNSIKNVVSTVVNSIKNVISTAWNSIKTIISSVMKLISSVLKGDWNGVKSAISSIVNAIKAVISSVWNGIKNVISSVMNGIKSVVSSVWNGIKSVVSSALNTIKSVVSSIWNGIKSAISNAMNGIKTTVVNGFKELPGKIKSVGKNIVEGLWKGITNAKDWLLNKIKGFAKTITQGIKDFFGIKSPSRVMRDEVGKMLAEGVAVGIDENTDKVKEKAEEMNKKILEAAQKKLEEYQTYNELTLADEIAFWDAVRQKCAEGTDARLEADKKYLEAKKSMNDQLLTAEQKLQKDLEGIQQSVADRTNELLHITSSDFGQALSGDDILGNLKHEVFGLEEYDKTIAELEKKIGGTKAFEDIKAGGIGNLNKAYEMAYFMTDEQLKQYVDLFDRKYSAASSMAQDETAEEVITKTAEAYQTYANTCAGLGVEIVNATDTMQQGVSGHFGTIETSINNVSTAFTKLKELFASFDWSSVAPGVASWFVSGSDTTTSNPAAYSLGSTGTASSEQDSWLVSFLERFLESMQGMKVVLDTGAVVGELAMPMDEALGMITTRKDRGR